MKRFFLFLAFFSIACIGAGGVVAYASEPLLFSRNLSVYEQFLLDKYPKNMEVAKIDINDDGLTDFVMRDCITPNQYRFCTFIFLGRTEKNIVPITTIQARTITVENELLNGLYALRVFNNPANDYKFNRYVWEPMETRYILQKEK